MISENKFQSVDPARQCHRGLEEAKRADVIKKLLRMLI